MIEAGGLGVHAPEEIGPAEMHASSGAIDLLVDDEAEAVSVTRRLLSVLPGCEIGAVGLCRPGLDCATWFPSTAAPRTTRGKAIEHPRRHGLGHRAASGVRPHDRHGVGADRRTTGRDHSPTTHATSVVRSIATGPTRRLASWRSATRTTCPSCRCAIRRDSWWDRRPRRARRCATSPGCSSPARASRCRGSRSCCARVTGSGRRRWRQARSTRRLSTASWPTGEFGGMNLEGAVRLGFRKELESIEDEGDRKNAFEAMVAEAYQRGKALNLASHFEVDDVIDPADTRQDHRRAPGGRAGTSAAHRQEAPLASTPGKRRPGVTPVTTRTLLLRNRDAHDDLPSNRRLRSLDQPNRAGRARPSSNLFAIGWRIRYLLRSVPQRWWRRSSSS